MILKEEPHQGCGFFYDSILLIKKNVGESPLSFRVEKDSLGEKQVPEDAY
jgi:hypothetical protein